MHRRCHEHRAPGGEEDIGEEVAGNAVGRPGQQVGRRGHHDDEIRLLAQPNVGDLVGLSPDGVVDRLARERLPGGGAHELERCCGRDHRDVMA